MPLPSVAIQRRRNLVMAFLGQNFALGLTYGAYGTILHSLQQEFSVSRAAASGGLSAMLLFLGLLSPFIGRLLQRSSIRSSMIIGALLNGLAYTIIALAPDIRLIFLGYALAGAGAAMLGIIAPTTLISRWYDSDRGKALGVVNLPVVLLVTPVVVAALLPEIGLRGIFGLLAALNFALAPLLLLVVDYPPPHIDDHGVVSEAGPVNAALPLRPILMSPAFWLITLGVGILTGAGTSFVVHFVSFATSRGFTLAEAGAMMGGYGLAGVAGTYAFGWLADKIPPHLALCFNALAAACLWALLLSATGFETMAILACLIGACTTALVALQGAAIGKLFGVAYVSTVMGVTYFFKLPFIFGSAPLVGYLFDRTGSYNAGIYVHILGFVAAALAFIGIGITAQARPGQAVSR